LKFIAFVLCLVWLVFLTLMGSINDYEWMLADSPTNVRSWYDLPPEQDPARAKCTIFESRFCSNLLFSLRLPKTVSHFSEDARFSLHCGKEILFS